MAGRVLRRAAAFGLATAAATSLYFVSQWTPPEKHHPYNLSMKIMTMQSAQGLQAALLRAHPLSGAHLRDVRARAELDLARVDVVGDGGDAAAATDLRLFLALLAARDGRTDDALRLYEEASRHSPFDPRPIALAYQLSLLAARMDEVARWDAAYRRLVPEETDGSVSPGLESLETAQLIHELAIAATLGGVYDLTHPEERYFLIPAACGEVDKGLVAVLQDKTLSMAARVRLLALRVYLQAKMRLLLWKEERDYADVGDDD